MHRNEAEADREPLNLRPILCGLLVVVGLVLFAVSFVWPGSSTRSAGWSTDQAVKYQTASTNLHRLSHEYARTTGTDKAPQVRAELQKAQSEFSELGGELESAIARPKRLAMMLRIGGLALAAIGAVGVFYSGGSGGD
jgi:hypothetical protein